MKCASALLVATACASDAGTTANPIRKVVTMLQQLQSRVEAEGAKEKELYDKYMCYCTTSGGDLSKTIAAAEAKEPQLAAAIDQSSARLSQTKEEVKSDQSDRAAAKTAMAEATALREKENAAFTKTSTDLRVNIAAIKAAVDSLNRGMAGAFLQSQSASVLKRLLVSNTKILDADRQDVSAFLSGTSAYAPASGQITGILKDMGDEMAADLSSVMKTEAGALASYESLMAAKKKEVDALTGMIETKLGRAGELAVKIQEMKNDLGDTSSSLVEDKKFLADLDKNCAEKESLFTANVNLRTQELAALADTIKLLNEDDALELFKKTLPGASASFVQMQMSRKQIQARALHTINKMRQTQHAPQLDFIALSLHGKKIGFDKVIGMIDNMVSELKTEQVNDDHKLEYCGVSLDRADDKKKVISKSISDLEAHIADAESNIAATNSDLASLESGLAALDKSVASATEQRKEEHQEYSAGMASNAAAKELLGFAKNRLNKFYNPALYKAPKAAMTQIAPAPESFGAYAKKGQASNGILALLDTLIADLDKDMTEAETTEKDSQVDYEALMKDSAEKRANDSRSLTDKQSALADLKTDLGNAKTSHKADANELLATSRYISSLHAECDWLLKYFDVRKEARASEIDSLGRAKAVLSGADFSLVQVHANSLRR